MKKSKTRCVTPRCIEAIEKYGEAYHDVHDKFTPSGLTQCCRCGAVQQADGSWTSKCVTCGKDIEPGHLVGLFVPHNCRECEDKVSRANEKRGHVCRMCRRPYNQCCC